MTQRQAFKILSNTERKFEPHNLNQWIYNLAYHRDRWERASKIRARYYHRKDKEQKGK